MVSFLFLDLLQGVDLLVQLLHLLPLVLLFALAILLQKIESHFLEHGETLVNFGGVVLYLFDLGLDLSLCFCLFVQFH